MRSWRRGRGAETRRLFFATDLHASEACFRKFLAAARVYEVDLLVLGGDVMGKALVPLVEDISGGGVQRGLAPDAPLVRDGAEVEALSRRVADEGNYAVRVSRERA